MIKMFYEDGEYRPYFQCDLCKKKITKDNPGVYIYDLLPNKDKGIDILMLCRKLCHEKNTEGKMYGWHKIDVFLQHITNNTINH